MGVILGLALIIIPWAIGWPESFLWRVIMNLLGGGLIWLSLRMSKG